MASVFGNKHCEMCKVIATSETVWKDHLNSKEHLKKLKALELEKETELVKDLITVSKDHIKNAAVTAVHSKTNELETNLSSMKNESKPKDTNKGTKDKKRALLVDEMNKLTSNQLTPRLYQLEVLEEAVQSNSLAFLGTGAGKTLIAVLFIKFRLALAKKIFELSIKASNGISSSSSAPLSLVYPSPIVKKIIAFLAPTKILVEQQCRYIKSNCDCNIKSYTGEANISGKLNYCLIFNTTSIIYSSGIFCLM